MYTRFRKYATMTVISFVMLSGCMKQPGSGDPSPPAPPLTATPADRQTVVAKVNGTAITRDYVIEAVNQQSAGKKRSAARESREEAWKRAVNRLIFDELAYQEARRQGLSLGEHGLDGAMEKLKAKVGTEEDYQKFLAKQELSDAELRSRVERALLIQLIVTREVVTKAVVPEDEVQREYESHRDQFVSPAKVTVVDVVLFIDLDDPAVAEKSDRVLGKIASDTGRELADQVGDGSYAVRTIDLDKEQEPVLYAAAIALKENERTGVIKTHDSFHVLQLVRYVPERQLSFDEVKGTIEGKLKAAAQRARHQEWERELRQRSVIEIMDAPAEGR